MEEVFKSLLNNNDHLELEDGISFLIYLASCTKQIVSINSVELVSKHLNVLLKNLLFTNCNEHKRIIDEIDKHSCIVVQSYRIAISDKWAFQLLVLCAIGNAQFLYRDKTNTYDDFIYEIVCYMLQYLDIKEPLTINLLRILNQLLTKRAHVLTPSLSKHILNIMNTVSLSPFHGFKWYAQKISKICLNYLSCEDKRKLCNLESLFVRSIETHDLVTLFSKEHITSNLEGYLRQVLKSFELNIHNKDGGILYCKIISYYAFEDWVNHIWPYFRTRLKFVDYEEEFFQSLVKYWIPYSVNRYTIEFNDFVKNEQIDLRIKAHVLVETLKRGHALTSDIINDLLEISNNVETIDIGLRIASTYFKKSLCPQKTEFDIIMHYLFSNLQEFLQEEQLKSFMLFFSQLFMYAHCDLAKSHNNFNFYYSLISDLYKYCYACLNTEFFEVGAQILQMTLTILKGSHKDLLLFYKLEKRDFYTNNDNNLYKHLIAQNLFIFDNEEMYHRLRCCLQKNGSSSFLTQCILIHYKTTKIVSLNKLIILLNDRKEDPSLKNTETIMNYSKILLQLSSLENKAFIEDLECKLVETTSTTNFEVAKRNMFAVTLYFGIINNGLMLGYGLEELHIVVKKCLEYVSIIIDGDISNNYPLLKVFESFIIMCLNCITQNFDHLWPKLDKIHVVPILLKIIERSNMKKPVTLSADALRCLALKMDEHGDPNFKVLLLDSALESISSKPSLDLKIRRNPESRLVIHSLCCSERNIHKPLLNWSMSNLLEIISDERSSDISIARTLHCIEILVANNGLHNHTLPYIPDIIVHCVELFRRTNWIIRNADLQLAKAIIDRFYGISLGYYNRPKGIEDLFILFPQLPLYFFKILCLEHLDERAIMIFQFFSESQVKQKLPDYLTYFQTIFMDIIRKYPHFYGKCAARCLVALCCSKEIPSVVYDLINYLKQNFNKIDKNIFFNMIFLLQELVAKIKNSEESENVQRVCHYMEDFQKFLGNFDTSLFDFLLVKTKKVHDISKTVPIKNYNNFFDRLWHHNNLPFLILNAKSSDLPNIIEPLLLVNMPVCFKVKILSILIFRFEKNSFSKEDLVHLMSVICKSTLSSDENPYLLLCYFKVIILFRQNIDSFIPQLDLVLESRNNLYKTLVALVYTSPSASTKAQFGFYHSALKVIIDSVGINEETDRDIMSSLIYINAKTDSSIFIKICKLVFYYSLYYSTHQEAYNFISLATERRFGSILEALSVFLSNESLQRYIKDDSEIDKLFHDMKEFVKIGYKYEMSDGYYSVDGDNLIPRQHLLKMLDLQNKNKKP